MFETIAQRSQPAAISIDVKPLASLDPSVFSGAGSTAGYASGLEKGWGSIAEGISGAGKTALSSMMQQKKDESEDAKYKELMKLKRSDLAGDLAYKNRMLNYYDKMANAATVRADKTGSQFMDQAPTSNTMSDFTNAFGLNKNRVVPQN